MKVEIEISPEHTTPHAVIYTNKITEELSQLISSLETNLDIVTTHDNDKLIIINPQDIYMIRIEESILNIYCTKGQYTNKKKLYEFKDSLSPHFLQISKSTIINLKKLDSVEPSFNGMMRVKLSNNLSDYISRKYLPDLKKYLGL